MPPFDEIWNRIIAYAGNNFYTKTGLEFTYEISGDTFFPSRTDYRIPKADFKKAYALVPLDGPGTINNVVEVLPMCGQCFMTKEFLMECGNEYFLLVATDNMAEKTDAQNPAGLLFCIDRYLLICTISSAFIPA